MDPAVFIRYLQNERLVMDNLYISAAALLIYDYLLTVHLEVKFIWFSHWGYTKILFLLIRYMAFADTFIVLHNQLFYDVPESTCKVTWPVAAWLLVWKMIFAEAVLAIRTWAVWRRNKVVGAVLAAVTVGNIVAQCILVVRFINSMQYAPTPYPGFQGCFLTGVSRILAANYASLTGLQAIVLGLMGLSAFRSYRVGHTNELSLVIHRDGILFYVYLLLITAANVVVITVSSLETMTMLSSLEDVLYSVLTARIVLNIRDVGRRGQETELHTGYGESRTQTMPLRFLPGDEYPQDRTTWSENSGKYEPGSGPEPEYADGQNLPVPVP